MNSFHVRFCENGRSKQEMMRQNSCELTLHKCLDQVRQPEQVKKQQGVMRPSSTSIDTVRSKLQHKKFNKNKNQAKASSDRADTCER